MKNAFFARPGMKLVCMLLCCLIGLNLTPLPPLQAQAEAPDFIMYEDFEGEDPLYNYINSSDPTRTYSAPSGTEITVVPNATGKFVRMAATEDNSSNKDNFIGAVIEGGIGFEEGETYIFETEFSTNNANGRKEIFRYGSNSSKAFLVVRNVSGSSYLVYPNTKEGATISDSSYISDTPIEHNRTYRFTFVVDGTTRKYDFYLDGEKVTLSPNNNLDGEPAEFAPLPERIEQTAPLRMFSQNRYLGNETTFDNIMAYKVGDFDVMRTNVDAGTFSAVHKEINVKFTNIVDEANPGTVAVYRGDRQIPGTVTVKGNDIVLQLEEELDTATQYTLKIEGTQDVRGETVPDTEIPFITNELLSYLDDDFEDEADFGNYTFTSRNADSTVTAAAVPEEENTAVKVQGPAPDSGSYDTTFSRYIPTQAMPLEEGKKYIFSVRVKSDVNGNQRRMFVYGSGDKDYLFNIKDSSGSLAAFQTNESATRLGTWTWQAADGWMELMAVLDGGTKTYDVFAFGEKLNAEPLVMTNPPEKMETIGFTYRIYNDTINYFDDIQIYSVSGLELEDTSTDDYDVVSTYERQIRLDYNLVLNPDTLGSIAIKDADENVVDCTASLDPDDRSKLVIDIEGNLLAGTAYTIDLSGLQDAILGENPENITFTTDNALNVSYPVVTDAGGEEVESLVTGDITASVKVNKANYTGDATNFTLLIAYYKGTKLTDIDMKVLNWNDITETDTEVTATVQVDDDTEGNYIKVFTMNDVNSINPFRPSRPIYH